MKSLVGSGVRALVIQAGYEARGFEIDNPITPQQAATILDHSDVATDVIEANVELFIKRIDWAQLIDHEAPWKNELDQFVAKRTEFDVAEATRHREALKRLDEMALEIDRARDKWMTAFEARHQLISTAQPNGDAAELQQQLTAVTEQIKRVERALNPKDAPGDDLPYCWGSIETSPARLASQTRAMLNDKRSGLSKERRQELDRQLAAAESSINEYRERLPQLIEQRDEINAKLTYGDNALFPPNFQMIAAKRPTWDESAKRQALERGFHGGSGVTVS